MAHPNPTSFILGLTRVQAAKPLTLSPNALTEQADFWDAGRDSLRYTSWESDGALVAAGAPSA